MLAQGKLKRCKRCLFSVDSEAVRMMHSVALKSKNNALELVRKKSLSSHASSPEKFTRPVISCLGMGICYKARNFKNN